MARLKSHNGIINAYSEKGHGTTFTIYLPAVKNETIDHHREVEPEKVTETILIVDDDQIASGAGRDILVRAGYRVIMTANGAEAIELYKSHAETIHLVLLDIILPDLNAEQIFNGLKKHNPNVQVILASGYNVNSQISALLNQGCLDFIQKPFQTQSLSSKIRRALDRKPISPDIAGGTT